MYDSFTLALELVSYDFISACCPPWFLGHQAFLLKHMSPHPTFLYFLLELQWNPHFLNLQGKYKLV